MIGKRILVLVGDFVDDFEAMVPMQILQTIGHLVDVACSDASSSKCWERPLCLRAGGQLGQLPTILPPPYIGRNSSHFRFCLARVCQALFSKSALQKQCSKQSANKWDLTQPARAMGAYAARVRSLAMILRREPQAPRFSPSSCWRAVSQSERPSPWGHPRDCQM